MAAVTENETTTAASPVKEVPVKSPKRSPRRNRY